MGARRGVCGLWCVFGNVRKSDLIESDVSGDDNFACVEIEAAKSFVFEGIAQKDTSNGAG